MSTTDPAFDALVRVWSDENGDLRYPLDVLTALRASGWDVVPATPAPLDVERLARAIHPHSCGDWHVNGVKRCERDAAAIAAAYAEETE